MAGFIFIEQLAQTQTANTKLSLNHPSSGQVILLIYR